MYRKLVIGICLILFTFDISGESQPPIIKLDGEWHFLPDSLVNPSAVGHVAWHKVKVPENWAEYESRSEGPFGFGSFYKKIKIPLFEDRPLAIRMPDVLSAHKVFINKQLIYESGRVATIRQEEEFGNYRYIRLLPDNINPGDSLEIVIHVSNFHYRQGGLLRSIELGSYDEMLYYKERSLFFEALQLGGVAAIGVFFLIYFMFRKKEKYIITFSLLCLGIFTYIFFNGEYVLLSLFPKLTGEAILAMIYIAFYFTVTINLILISELFPDEIPYWLIQVVKIIGLLFVLSVILLPMYIYSYTLPVFRIYAIVSGLYLIYKLLMAAIHNRPGAKIIWLASSVIFIFMLNDLLHNAHIIETGEYIGWGVLFYLMILMVVSSRRFSSAISNEEKLMIDLKKLNDNLAYKVRERTEDLEEKSRIIAEQQQKILRKNQELIKSREEEKGMIKNIVHDLKSPFNKISGLLGVFHMELGPVRNKELDKVVEMIGHVAQEGSSMVEDLNVVTFFEDSLNSQEDIEELDLMMLLDDLVQGFRGYAEKKHIQLEFASPVKKYTIETHVKSLTRIIDNLLSNAIKFSHPHTRVWLSIRPLHDVFEIEIRDEGPGFTAEDKENMFEKFQKLSAKPTSNEISTGLGLNIVKTLTEGLDGLVEVIDEPIGAHFKLTFPRKVKIQG